MRTERTEDKETRFLAVTDQFKSVIAKVCYMYSSASAPFEDLYQEVLVNLWSGLDSFRGDAKMSTWIYRTALNTCITWHRRSRRHYPDSELGLESIADTADNSRAAEIMEEYAELHRLISLLNPIDKAIITLWLDEKSNGEIAAITGLSVSNVAVRLHRIKDRLSKLAEKSDLSHT